ncbi:MAG: DNA polymerase III subunit beta [Deltaproteobacteria bacterium]|nr:DNA polymerase III subunit beta [Deltaproteobacteria bacterium]
MEFKVKREAFLNALYWTQSTVERRTTMPILANVLIEFQKGNTRVTATDLEVGVRAKMDGEIVEEGAVTLNAKKLYEIVRESGGETIQLKRLENDWVEIKSGKSVFKMVGLDPKDFPSFPEFGSEHLFSVPAKVIKEMIDKTMFAVSTDETRSNLNGAFLEEGEGGKLRMVATDGHRLALIERSVGSLGLAKGVILPRKGLAELKKLLEESDEEVAQFGFKDNMASVMKGNVELFMRLSETDFPDYSKVIPKENPYNARVEQRGFLQALKRVSILSSERYKGIRIEVKPANMSISANNPDLGEAVEELEADYKGKALAVGFNARYLIDVLSVLGDEQEVGIEMKDELSPSLLRKEGDEGYMYVVMPMKL